MQIYLKTTPPGESAVITWHMVWDAELFIAARKAEALAAAAKDKKKPSAIEQATEEEYRVFKGYGQKPSEPKKRKR